VNKDKWIERTQRGRSIYQLSGEKQR